MPARRLNNCRVLRVTFQCRVSLVSTGRVSFHRTIERRFGIERHSQGPVAVEFSGHMDIAEKSRVAEMARTWLFHVVSTRYVNKRQTLVQDKCSQQPRVQLGTRSARMETTKSDSTLTRSARSCTRIGTSTSTPAAFWIYHLKKNYSSFQPSLSRRLCTPLRKSLVNCWLRHQNFNREGS